MLDIDALLPSETVNRGAMVARAASTPTTNPSEDPPPNRNIANVQRQLQIDLHPRHTQVNPEPYGSRMIARDRNIRRAANVARPGNPPQYIPGVIVPRDQLEDEEEVEVLEDFSQYLLEWSSVNPTTTTNPTIDENAVDEMEQVENPDIKKLQTQKNPS